MSYELNLVIVASLANCIPNIPPPFFSSYRTISGSSGGGICPDSIAARGSHVTQLWLLKYKWKLLGGAARKAYKKGQT